MVGNLARIDRQAKFWKGSLLHALSQWSSSDSRRGPRLRGPRIRLHLLDVGVVEARGVFKAEAEHAVEADMADPDGGEGKQNRFGSEEGNRDERRWSEIGVDEVVAGSSDPDAHEIAEHAEIGCKEEHGEEQPTGVKVVVEENGPEKNERAFDLKQEFGSGHLASIAL